MLGGDKAFNDRLCWLLALPLSLLAFGAVVILFVGVELVFEGDAPGSAKWWVAPLMDLCGGLALVRMGASVAPSHKFKTALVLAALYGLATLAWSLSRRHADVSAARIAVFVGFGAAGAAAGCWAARHLRDDDV